MRSMLTLKILDFKGCISCLICLFQPYSQGYSPNAGWTNRTTTNWMFRISPSVGLMIFPNMNKLYRTMQILPAEIWWIPFCSTLAMDGCRQLIRGMGCKSFVLWRYHGGITSNPCRKNAVFKCEDVLLHSWRQLEIFPSSCRLLAARWPPGCVHNLEQQLLPPTLQAPPPKRTRTMRSAAVPSWWCLYFELTLAIPGPVERWAFLLLTQAASYRTLGRLYVSKMSSLTLKGPQNRFTHTLVKGPLFDCNMGRAT